MMRLGSFFKIEPLDRPGDSAAVYVPLVMASRGLAFVRTLLVARLIGILPFGAYQPALELINLLVAFVLLGAADVTERYISRVEQNLGPQGARRWLMMLAIRVGATAIGATVILEVLSPWVSRAIWGIAFQWPALLPMCCLTVIFLALYQQLAAALRGLGAFGAAAGMEGVGAVLLLVLSVIAAFRGSPVWLIGAYAASVAIPYGLYAAILWRFMDRQVVVMPTGVASSSAPDSPPVLLSYGREDPTSTYHQFAFWTLARLILTMAFGFLAIWGVRYLGDVDGLEQAADFSVCYRIAQILGFLGVTMWASVYGIAARASSQGRTGRARVQFFRVGRLGMAALIVVALLLLLARGYLARALPRYDRSIDDRLPGFLGMFLWYALVAFTSNYADLREKPQHGAAIWGTAVFMQMLLIAWPDGISSIIADVWIPESTSEYMLGASALGLVAALIVGIVFALARTRWPYRFTRISTPLIILGIAPAGLFSPTSIVNYVGPVFLSAVLAFLVVSGQLIRPMDRRAIGRWWKRRFS